MSVELEVMAEGLFFPEGPVALADGSVLVVEIGARQVTRIGPGGAKTVVARIHGAPNGAALGPDGRLYVCNNGGGFAFGEVAGVTQPVGGDPTFSGGRIERIDLATGTVERLIDSVEGRALLMPNDLVFDRRGGLYFTDHGVRHAGGIDFGGVFHLAPDGTARTVFDPIWTANGVGLSPDESRLYVADTETGLCYRFMIEAPGIVYKPAQNRPWEAMLPRVPGYGRCDSLAVEESGNICLASLTPGGITVLSPDGELVEFVGFPDAFVTNICFGGDDMRTAYVTLSGTGRLVRLRWPRPGLRLNFSALEDAA